MVMLNPNKIKDIRLSTGLKRGKFGAMLGLKKRSCRTVKSWENGITEISGPCEKLIQIGLKHGFEILK